MTSLATQLGLGQRELVALVGGGGKSTILFELGRSLAADGRRVILTTTTKMSRDQAMSAPTICWLADELADSFGKPGPVMLLTGADDRKATGPRPEVIDGLFANTDVDYIIVEADGARGRPLKAPGPHEPVVPVSSTVVVIVFGIDAVGGRVADVVHRVEVAERFTGLLGHGILTPADCVKIVTHPEGVLRACPARARVVVAVTKVGTDAQVAAAEEIETRLLEVDRINDVLLIRNDRTAG